MLFTSVTFLVYFLPAALLLYMLCNFSRLLQNICLLVLSLVFYAWGEPAHIIPMLYTILVNYVLGLFLTGKKSIRYKKKIVTIAVVLNIGMLLCVLYGNTVLATVCNLADIPIPLTLPAPPLGVSFFILQALTYIFDVSRGKAAPEKNIINVGLFVALFPTVLAGPVMRYGEIGNLIRDRRTTPELFGKGGARFVIGFGKLLLLAAPLGLVADTIFNLSALGPLIYDVPVMLAWLGLAAFSLQIYLAFSAYSDMAIGLGSMFGFFIRENFNYPYTACTVTDFWKRWNISVFRWFYLYVFLVMGGQRAKRVKVRGVYRPRNFILRNSFVMWLLIGLWYGMDWSFLVWGLWFFFLYLLEWIVRLPRRRLKGLGWNIYVLLAIGIGWVFFRCETLGHSMTYLSNLLGLTSNGLYSDLAVLFIKENWPAFVLGILFSTPIARKTENLMRGNGGSILRYPMALLYPLFLAGVFCLSIIYLTRTGKIPFVF